MLRRLCARGPLAVAAAATASAALYYTHQISHAAAAAAAADPASSPAGVEAGVEALASAALKAKFVVCSPTFYPNLSDVRLQLGLEACRSAKKLGVPLLLIDASPPDVKAALLEAGATAVLPQTFKGRKGAALRECVHVARSVLDDDGVIAFQELEKVDMIGHQRSVAQHIWRTGLDVVVPGRADALFKGTYPIEQYHQERFANLYLNTLGVAAGLPNHIDWTMGPVALRATMARHWLEDDGELWDAQIVPYVRAARWHGAKVGPLELEYHHPRLMKAEEEGVAVWGEKRLMQLNFLFKFIAGALKTKTADERVPK
jgi:hypothetical protein